MNGMELDEYAVRSVNALFNQSDWTEWLMLKADDCGKITVDDFGITWQHQTPSQNWDLFVKSLPATECRYALVTLKEHQKYFFIMWAPSKAKVKDRLSIAMHMVHVKEHIEKIGGHAHATLQAHELDDLSYERALTKITLR